MAGLTAEALMRAWEAGLVRSAVERPLAILAAADATSMDDLLALPLGRRNARLLALREATFGSRFQAIAACPSCGERLELTFDAGDVRPDALAAAVAVSTLRLGEYAIDVRPLDSRDLAAAAQCADAAAARRVLAERVIGTARRGDAPVAAHEIVDEIIPALAAHLEAIDPDADMMLETTCSACGTRWDSPFDIAAYLWTELEALAIRLLRDVHCLARAYGWREAEILAMTPLRRRAYLELVQG